MRESVREIGGAGYLVAGEQDRRGKREDGRVGCVAGGGKKISNIE